MIKTRLMLTIFILFFVLLIACSSENDSNQEVGEDKEGDRVFNLEELSQYNGKDGNPAYVAVDGVVYDVSNSNRWKNGEHNGNQAGNDLTEEINTLSPHGSSVLERMPIVGTLKEKE